MWWNQSKDFFYWKDFVDELLENFQEVAKVQDIPSWSYDLSEGQVD